MNELVSIASELVTERKMLLEAVKRLEKAVRIAPGTSAQLSVNALHESISRVGGLVREILEMTQSRDDLELGVLVQMMEKNLQEASVKNGKEIRITCSDGDKASVDSEILRRIGEPLEELLALSLEYGVESAQERTLRGKNTVTEFKFSITPGSNGVSLSILYDGNGIEPPVSMELSKVLGEAGIRASFRGVPGRWSVWTVTFASNRKSLKCLRVVIGGGVEVAVPMWAQAAHEKSNLSALEISPEWNLKERETQIPPRAGTLTLGAGTRKVSVALDVIRGADEVLVRQLPSALLSEGRILGLGVWPGIGTNVVELLPILNPSWIVHEAGVGGANG